MKTEKFDVIQKITNLCGEKVYRKHEQISDLMNRRAKYSSMISWKLK